MKNEKKLVGVFQSEQEAVRAIEGLKRQGYSPEDISVIARDKDDVSAVTEQTGTSVQEGVKAGAATGGVLGGLAGLLAGLGALTIPGVGPILAAGPIAAALTGAAVGAGAGGLVGGLVGLGIPEEDAERYNDYVKQGSILVLVNSRGDIDHEVYDAFRSNNSLNSDTYGVDRGAEIGSRRGL